MDLTQSLLKDIQVASPCSASWANMKGDARVRHCEQCGLRVYNLSEMSRVEAEALVRESEGRLCARFYRRRDGTILTRDCPVGLGAVCRRLERGLTVAALAVVAVVGAVLGSAGSSRDSMRLREVAPFSRICNWFAPVRPPPTLIVGRLVMPPPRPTGSSPPSPVTGGN